MSESAQSSSAAAATPRVWYACQRCTECCKWPGDVVLEDGEVERMAAHLGLPLEQFIQEFTRLRANRQGLSLTEKANGECILLEGKDCRVNAVKPEQCRGFPNRWRFPGWQEKCKAIPGPWPADQPS